MSNLLLDLPDLDPALRGIMGSRMLPHPHLKTSACSTCVSAHWFNNHDGMVECYCRVMGRTMWQSKSGASSPMINLVGEHCSGNPDHRQKFRRPATPLSDNLKGGTAM